MSGTDIEPVADAAPGANGLVDAAAAELFEFPAVESDPAALLVAPSVGQLEQLSRQAWEEGHALGHEAGLAAGREEGLAAVTEQARALSAIVGELAAPLADMDEEVVAEIARLALQIARQVVRREIQTEPGEVVGAVREALRELSFADHDIVVWLHPEDLPLVSDALQPEGDVRQRWRLEAQPSIERGGCLVETVNARVDNTVEARIGEIASRMFGGDRQGDSEA